ncbi:MAG: serine/threonine protein kinase [Labilithrix sp.]|nr:serine/threonine protein kinase [Labilithrix sp.]MCW5810857.1 serine/threonine protein kinase [Labilithrix sp.]
MGWLPAKGDVVLGKYRVTRQLGRGGMGVVYEAVNVATDGRVALKLMSPGAEDAAERISRMEREARAAARLRSRFVARVLDFDAAGGAPVMVMELLEGHDLSAEMRQAELRQAGLRCEDAVSYVIQACAGIAEAHAAGIIHRDLKPGNLFLDRSNPASPMIRVLDFGLSKLLDHDNTSELTSPSEAIGTLSYMSPEQMRASKHVDARADVWSLGVILFRLLTGSLPAEGRGLDLAARVLDDKPLPNVDRRDVPRDLSAVVARALEKNAAKRFPDARALGRALVPFVAEPSPMTKLAIDELAVVPSARDVAPSTPAAVSDESSTNTVVTADTIADRTETTRAWNARPRSRRVTDVWRDRRAPLIATGVLVVATLALAMSLGPKKTPRAEPAVLAPAAPPQRAAIPPVLVPAASPPPAVTAIAIPTVLPAAKDAAAPPAAPATASTRPRARPPRPTNRYDENPTRL